MKKFYFIFLLYGGVTLAHLGSDEIGHSDIPNTSTKLSTQKLRKVTKMEMSY